MRKIIGLTAAFIMTVLTIVGCSGVNHDAPNPTRDIQTQWVRIETPPSFLTLMFTCIGNTAFFEDQGDANTGIVQNFYLCPISKVFDPAMQQQYGFKVVTRTDSNGAGNS